MGVKLGLRMLQSRVLRKIYEHKRDDIWEDWRILNRELHQVFYRLPNSCSTTPSGRK
jgi:hypothetical protein